ncbi:MAG: ribbon-helix-helix domain-containing protein [Rhodospirillaceae bacterium]|nr:ribbon-helix-helix domain-containing protein [Rhodospirillaceae bacterium]MBT4218732.1 ribbon-helix-helix domain-containing protein [Rhodospirillaceae bacterium]MBT4463097.1 ribbon-helix-helix domain-containing protein [Rhodospirillaceae bacterium]MBT5013822.1 ribbon-helix-helix domain-containing protein [Rhodospirillaceae bacterium]MBT5308681.1 ribbon-helix-helix domain-containing protein [Rhodospirillaceae bacterium]
MRKHSLLIAGHQTSVTVEDAFWDAFKDIARARSMTLNSLATEIDTARGDATGNLSSAIRVHVLKNALSSTP